VVVSPIRFILSVVDLIRHRCDALIEIFPIIEEVRNDPDDTGR